MWCNNAGSDSSESDGPPVHYLARDRKRKKKKLKSRRERNKQKAIVILKLSHQQSKQAPSASSHHAASFIPLASRTPTTATAAPHEEKKSATERAEGSTSLLSGGVTDTHKNNGIPIFVQERLEERNKRKGDMGPDEVKKGVRGTVTLQKKQQWPSHKWF